MEKAGEKHDQQLLRMQFGKYEHRFTAICVGQYCLYTKSSKAMNTDNQSSTLETTSNNSYIINSSVDEVLFVGYMVIVPMICTFGSVGNVINLIVLQQPEFRNKSPYIFLRALSVADLTTVMLEILNTIVQGASYNGITWKKFDVYFHLPVGSVSSTMSICILTTYTLERFIFIKAPILARRYCRPSMVRWTLVILLSFSILFNIPYFFAIYVDETGELCYTPFTKSTYYQVHNWVRLFVLGFIPESILIVVNCNLLHALYEVYRKRRILLPRIHLHEQYRLHQRAKVTVCLAAVIILFLIGEVPANITSRTSALNFLYGGDADKLQTAQYQIIRMVSTVLMCLQFSMNFLLYCSLDRVFGRVFRRVFCKTCHKDTKVKSISIKAIK